MEKKFCKTYLNHDWLEIVYIANLPSIRENTNPDTPPDEEMEKDKNCFAGRRYNENLLTELQQRGFSKDV